MLAGAADVVGEFTHVPIIAHDGLCRAVFRGRRGQRHLRGAGRSLRAIRRRLCASGTGLSATALRRTRLRISAAFIWAGISRTGIGLRRVRRALPRAAGLCRTRAPPIPSVTTLPSVATLASPTTRRIATTARDATMRSNTRRDRRRPCPTVRARDATMVMAGGSPAIRSTAWQRLHCGQCCPRHPLGPINWIGALSTARRHRYRNVNAPRNSEPAARPD